MSANDTNPEPAVVGTFCMDCFKKKPMFGMYAGIGITVIGILFALNILVFPEILISEDTIYKALSVLLYGLVAAADIMIFLLGIQNIRKYCNPTLQPKPDGDGGRYDPHDNINVIWFTLAFTMTIIISTVLIYAFPTFMNYLQCPEYHWRYGECTTYTYD